MKVIIYEQPNYEGKSQVLDIGNYNTNSITIGNDRLSSIKISNGLAVTLYQYANFYGRKLIVTEDMAQLPSWFDNETSSIVVKLGKVIIYEGANYRGRMQILDIGSYNTNKISIKNDSLSSIKIPKGFEVTLYENADFQGAKLILTRDFPQILGGFDNKTSSIIIKPIIKKVTIYEHEGYRGKMQVLDLGSYNMNRITIGNDNLSSIRIPKGFEVTLYEHANFQGQKMTLRKDLPRIPKWFNDKTSSIIVKTVIKKVTIYKYDNYRGKMQVLEVGNYNMNDITIGNDSLSSVEVPKGFEVILYQHADFQGRRLVLTQDIPQIPLWFNNETSSIVVKLAHHDETKLTVYLRGSALDSSEGSHTYLQINGISKDMPTKRGLNTVILTRQGRVKNTASHDVFDNRSLWDNWADWVDVNAKKGNIVAVASHDAIDNAPRGGHAERLLKQINANIAFNTAFEPTATSHFLIKRVSYVLLFVQGSDTCKEIAQPHHGPNAHLKTTIDIGVSVIPLEGIIKVAIAFKELGYSTNDTGRIIKNEFNNSVADFSKILKGAGYTATEIDEVVRYIYGLSEKGEPVAFS